MRAQRGLGWDVDTSFSANRGELMPLGSFGHTGFTGTSIWVDPRTKLFVIFLSSRLHPDGIGDVAPLRARVATIAASALTGGRGLDDLTGLRSTGTDFGAVAEPGPSGRRHADDARAHRHRRAGPRRLRARCKGRKVGLGHQPHRPRRRTARRRSTCCTRRPGVSLVALFSPEHGIRGVLDVEDVPSSKDDATGLPIHSLYGETRRPTDGDARRASTRWSSTCRTSAPASTPTRRRWAT